MVFDSPWTMAPCICPSTICGLMICPTSSEVVQVRILNWPVSISTSTVQTSALKAIIGFSASKKAVCSRPPDSPSGRLIGAMMMRSTASRKVFLMFVSFW